MIPVKTPSQKHSQEGRGRIERLAKRQGIPAIDLIKHVIEAEGSVYKAAVRLKVSRTTLTYHLRKAGITTRIRTVVEFVALDTGRKS